jgi:hypothetical protein
MEVIDFDVATETVMLMMMLVDLMLTLPILENTWD